MVKVLICENWEDTGRLLVEECEKDDHVARLLARDGDRTYVTDNIERVIREFDPDYMIIDHLRDRCFEVIYTARRIKPSIIAIVHTTHKDILDRAIELGIPCYKKHNCQALDNMFWYIIEEERKDS